MTRPEDEYRASERALHARQELQEVKELFTGEEWTLLWAVGEGREYDEIAAKTGKSAGALRVRILRLRHRLRERTARSGAPTETKRAKDRRGFGRKRKKGQ
jgi:DNA-directed RNA polymerase specialized sigma24 family protein